MIRLISEYVFPVHFPMKLDYDNIDSSVEYSIDRNIQEPIWFIKCSIKDIIVFSMERIL